MCTNSICTVPTHLLQSCSFCILISILYLPLTFEQYFACFKVCSQLSKFSHSSNMSEMLSAHCFTSFTNLICDYIKMAKSASCLCNLLTHLRNVRSNSPKRMMSRYSGTNPGSSQECGLSLLSTELKAKPVSCVSWYKSA